MQRFSMRWRFDFQFLLGLGEVPETQVKVPYTRGDKVKVPVILDDI